MKVKKFVHWELGKGKLTSSVNGPHGSASRPIEAISRRAQAELGTDSRQGSLHMASDRRSPAFNRVC